MSLLLVLDLAVTINVAYLDNIVTSWRRSSGECVGPAAVQAVLPCRERLDEVRGLRAHIARVLKVPAAVVFAAVEQRDQPPQPPLGSKRRLSLTQIRELRIFLEKVSKPSPRRNDFWRYRIRGSDGMPRVVKRTVRFVDGSMDLQYRLYLEWKAAQMEL
eukprot:scaffold24014_cov16-Tisochrysis_lutea.AAC.1